MQTNIKLHPHWALTYIQSVYTLFVVIYHFYIIIISPLEHRLSTITLNSLMTFQGTTPVYQSPAPVLDSHAAVGSIPGSANIPNVIAPTPTPGFMPMASSAMVPRPGMGTMQPPSPPQPAATQQPVVAPAAPPPTIQTADTSNVPGNYQQLYLEL